MSHLQIYSSVAHLLWETNVKTVRLDSGERHLTLTHHSRQTEKEKLNLGSKLEKI